MLKSQSSCSWLHLRPRWTHLPCCLEQPRVLLSQLPCLLLLSLCSASRSWESVSSPWSPASSQTWLARSLVSPLMSHLALWQSSLWTIWQVSPLAYLLLLWESKARSALWQLHRSHFGDANLLVCSFKLKIDALSFHGKLREVLLAIIEVCSAGGQRQSELFVDGYLYVVLM